MSKKIKIIFVLVIVVFLFCFIILVSVKDKATYVSVSTELNKKIIVDAGHGGFDGGAVASDGTNEKDINLSIALSLGEMLYSCGYDVIYTRTVDTGTEDNSNETISKRKVSDLNNRLAVMNENSDAIFVSIHLNKFTATSVNGAQVFYSPNHKKSYDLGESIQSNIVSLLQNSNKRVVKKSDSSTFLLKKAPIPAVIVECGFISNPNELDLLKKEEYQKKMAFAVFCGIEDYIIKTRFKNGRED